MRFVIFGLLSRLHILHAYLCRPLNAMSKRPVAKQKRGPSLIMGLPIEPKRKKKKPPQSNVTRTTVTHIWPMAVREAGPYKAAMLWAK